MQSGRPSLKNKPQNHAETHRTSTATRTGGCRLQILFVFCERLQPVRDECVQRVVVPSRHDGGTVRIPFLISEFEFEHVFFICKDSTVAILGNDFVVTHQIHLFMAEG